MFAVPGCALMLEIVFFKTSSPLVFPIRSVKGFPSFLSEMLINSRLACHVHRVHRSTHEVWKARMWLAATHYFESETYKQTDYAHQNTSRSDQIENIERKHSRKVFIICSVRFSILYKNCKTRSIFNYSNNSLLVCSLIEFKNNCLCEYNSQLSRFVFYLNRHIAASLSESFISCQIHGLK